MENGMKEIQWNGLPIWLVIFPEGTRFNPISNQHNLHKSRLFAQEKGLMPFDRVLYPRSGATLAAIKALKHQFDAVYDVTIMYHQTEKGFHLSAPSMFGRNHRTIVHSNHDGSFRIFTRLYRSITYSCSKNSD